MNTSERKVMRWKQKKNERTKIFICDMMIFDVKDREKFENLWFFFENLNNG